MGYGAGGSRGEALKAARPWEVDGSQPLASATQRLQCSHQMPAFWVQLLPSLTASPPTDTALIQKKVPNRVGEVIALSK